MQRKLLLVVLFMTSLHVAFSQVKRELDWQDFKNSVDKSKIVEPVKWGTLTVFQIKNINKFLYKVTITGRMFELQTPMPSELQTLFRLSPVDLQKTVTNTKADEAVNQSEQGLAKVSHILATELQKNNSVKSQAETEFEKLKNENAIYIAKLKQLSKDLLALKRSRNRLISIAQKDMSHAEISTEVAGVPWPIPGIETNYSDAKAQYETTVNQVESAKLAAAGDADYLKSIEAIATNLKKAATLIEEEALLTLIDDVEYLYTELSNESNFIVTAPPVQMDGDVVNYEVTITPTITKTLAPYRNPMKFSFDVPAKGGLNVDFSVGPTLSFGGHAKNQNYFLKETESADTVILKRSPDKNTLNPGLAAFMHMYPHNGKVGGVFGIGAGFQNTSNINVNLYLGLTTVWGKSQKVMGSLGVSYLKVDRIKDAQFEENTKYPVSKITLADVTESVYRPSFFLSISYNLSNRVEITR